MVPSLTFLVQLSSSERKNLIFKDLINGEFEYQRGLQLSPLSYPNLRILFGTISANEVFVYDFFAGSLLYFSKRAVTQASHKTRKGTPKSDLTGFAHLHEKQHICSAAQVCFRGQPKATAKTAPDAAPSTYMAICPHVWVVLAREVSVRCQVSRRPVAPI
jgi:hypothetical protein